MLYYPGDIDGKENTNNLKSLKNKISLSTTTSLYTKLFESYGSVRGVDFTLLNSYKT